MAKKQNFHSKFTSFLYNHTWLRYTLDYGTALIATLISAFVFAFGFNTFLKPENLDVPHLVAGGASGLSQVIALSIEIIGFGKFEIDHSLVISVLFFVINIPLIILSFKNVGFRFTLFTLINVLFVSIFTRLFSAYPLLAEFSTKIATFVSNEGGMLSRTIFAGICSGLSSALAFVIDSSAGGVDIISFMVSNKKSTQAGKYGVIINNVIVFLFTILTAVYNNKAYDNYDWAEPIGVLMFSFVYMFVVMLVIDFINVRNKKVQITIITENEDMGKILISRVPHGATVLKGKGVYSGVEKNIFYMTVSTVELKHIVSFVKEVDPNSFVNVVQLQQVYGKFFQKPIK